MIARHSAGPGPAAAALLEAARAAPEGYTPVELEELAAVAGKFRELGARAVDAARKAAQNRSEHLHSLAVGATVFASDHLSKGGYSPSEEEAGHHLTAAHHYIKHYTGRVKEAAKRAAAAASPGQSAVSESVESALAALLEAAPSEGAARAAVRAALAPG